MRKSKKFLALLTALSISVSAFAGFTATAFAAGETVNMQDAEAAWAVQYTADKATHSNANITTTDRTVKIGGQSYTVKALGSISGGIEGAASGIYNKESGGTATFNVTVDTAGEYNITVTGLGQRGRRADIAVGDAVYSFPTDTSEEYADKWTVISDSDSDREVFTYTFESIALAAGENTVSIGTKVAETWGPDLVGVDVTQAGPTVIPDGITYKNGTVTVKATDVQTAELIYARYNTTTGAVKSVETYPLTFTDGIAEQAVEGAVNGAKLMVWDSLSGMKPICPTATVTGGIEATPDPTAAPATDAPSTPAPTPTETPAPKPTIDPSLIVYSEDYTNAADVAAAGWTSQYFADGLSIASDKECANYINFKNSTGKGQRTAYRTLPSEAAATVDDQVVVEFDFRLYNGGGQGTNQVVLLGTSDTPIGNDLNGSKSSHNTYILEINQPKDGGNEFYVNRTGTSVADATVKSTGYKNNTWAHAKAVINFKTRGVIVTITSLDGSTTFVETTQVTMGSGATAVGTMFLGMARDNCVGSVDNIIVRKLTASDITDTYYTATFDVDGKETVMSAKEGETLEKLPDVTKTGYIFDGWNKDDDTTVLYTSEQVLSAAMTANVKYTAVYHKDPAYIEPMVAVEFSSFPTDGLPEAGPDADTAADNPIKVKLVGELGNDLLANPDERVTDFKVNWEFDGFRTVVSKGEPTTDIKENEYCDSYAEVVYNESDPTEANFKLKGQAFNFYGQVKATVTYNGNTITISKPMSILPDKTAKQGVLLPKPGYVSDFGPLEDTMVGYKATISADNKAATDIVTGDWAAYGGNSGRGLYIASEEGKKFLQLNSTGSNSSSFAVNKLDNAPTGQVIITQDVRFHNANSSILFKSLNPVTWTAGSATSISLNFTGTEFNLNGGEKIADATTGVWYKIVLSADVTSKLCYAKIYDAEGKLLGESDIMPFVDAGSTTPVYLCYRTPDNAQGKLDFNNVTMYTPEIAGELSTTIENETLSVPEAGDPATSTTLTVTAKSTEGYDMIGAAEWTVVDEPENVTITPAADNSHSAVLSVASGAQPGEITVRVSLGGKTKDIPVTLSSSQDSVSFTKQTKSISIPLTADTSESYVYEAAVVDKSGNAIAGKTVTYAMYDKNNVNELTTPPSGISFNKDTATLTVTSEAKATTVYIRATGTNTSNETISRAVKVTIHGLAFDFGTDADGAVAEGYTAVTPGTVYSDTTGYGIEGTATAGGTADAENADSDNLAGSFTFKAKVEASKVYNVTVNYKGSAASEYVNVDLTGIALTNEAQSAVTYEIPVIDDVLDLAFTNATVSSIVIEKQADKQPGGKPNVFTVGDSTIANNGSWAYVLARDYGAKYTALADIATFSNNGRGGKNLSSYYTGGELRDRVLKNIKPGDYVMIGDMGTNGMGTKFEESFNYYIDACEAMGAKVILNSYSPHGCVGDYAGGYNSETHTFNSYRQDSYDNIVRAIYAERTEVGGEKYDANIIGFVDIGKMADAAFNAYVKDYAANGHADENAAAQAIISCFGDHNHYSNGALAAQLMIEGYGDGADAKGIVKSLVEIITADLAK